MSTLSNPSELIPSDQNRIMLLVAASFVILATAWGYEIIGGYNPCPLCLKERWAYYFTIVAGPVALWSLRTSRETLTVLILALIALAFLANTAAGIYHSGVEWKWWPGPTECSGANLGGGSGSVLDKIKDMRVIRCDEAPWRFLGLSFAGYNAVFSAGLSAFSTWTALTVKR